MAKAEFRCAKCNSTVTTYGRNRSDAEGLAKWHAARGHLCEACKEVERLAAQAVENAEAAIMAAEMGLPSLTGSDKQVTWAETIRTRQLGKLSTINLLIPILEEAAHIEATLRGDAQDEAIDKLQAQSDQLPASAKEWSIQAAARDAYRQIKSSARFAILLELANEETRASWWIDHRDASAERLAYLLKEQIDEREQQKSPVDTEEAAAAQAAQAEAILLPASAPTSQIVAELRLVGSSIEIRFPEKRESFRDIVKALGFRWNEVCWSRKLSNVTAGNPIDRLAETAHRLVSGGFIVRMHDEEARAKALSGTFEAENTRWVTKSTGSVYTGWACITWPRSDDLYNAARSLPGSRYKSGAVFVPPGAIEAVADFAQRYGFSMSPGASELLDAHRAALAGGAVITDVRDRPASIQGPDTDIPPRLDAPADLDIDPSLMD